MVIASPVGRDGELGLISRFLDGTAGRSGVLVLSGPAGIGKTTLWEVAHAEARRLGRRVVVSRPTEVETSLAFAGLHDLIDELADDALAELPEPQRVALEAALLRVPAAERPEPLAVSVATGQVIRRAASERPLVLAVDDIQWLDEPSARVLDFVLRRLDTEPVALIAGRRTTSADDVGRPLLPGIPADRRTTVDVGPLSVDAVDRVVRERLGLELARPALVRLHAAAGGNPFYALELARTLAGRDVGGDVLAVPPSLEALVAGRLADLDDETADLVMIASAAAEPTVDLLTAAVERDARPALARAEAAGVLEVRDGGVRFSHPLLAAAAYGRASEERRRVVHRRLADIAVDAEERARHLAHASVTPDADVSAALEDAAVAVAGRGAPDSAAGLAERAADLTPSDDPAAEARRRAIAADLHIAAGDVERARRQLGALVDAAAGPSERAAALARLAHLLLVQAEFADARSLYREAADLVDVGDLAQRASIELGLAGVAYVTWEDRPGGARHAHEALRLADEAGDPVALFQALGHAASWRGLLGEDWRELMERADALAPTVSTAIPGVEHPDLQFARLLGDVGEFDAARRRLQRLIDQATERGDWHSLPRLLTSLAWIEWRTGDLGLAERILEEARTGMLQTGEGAWMENVGIITLWVAVIRGDVEEARRIQRHTQERLAANPLLTQLRWATTLAAAELAFSRGDATTAHAGLARLMEVARTVTLEPAFLCQVVVLDAETLVALGRGHETAATLELHAGRLRGAGIPWIDAELDRAEAVVLAADGRVADAMDRSERGLDAIRSAGLPYLLGRALLTAGEIRRRGRQKARARDALDEAVRVFERLGARIWADRARTELARVARRREPGAPLTATERQVVDLVAHGRSNKEIADALFMSVHTVEAHLTRLYRAFDVQGRTELARLRLEGTDPRLATPVDADTG